MSYLKGLYLRNKIIYVGLYLFCELLYVCFFIFVNGFVLFEFVKVFLEIEI